MTESNKDRSKCILAGVDTLELGVSVNKYKLNESDWKRLNDAKESAQKTRFEKGTVVDDFYGHKFEVKRVGNARYNLILSNADVTININNNAEGGKHFPELFIALHSTYLWRHGYKAAAHEILEWIENIADVVAVNVSRCDITADFSFGIPIVDGKQTQFVTRAKSRKKYNKEMGYEEYQEGVMQSGFILGKSPMARIYDKLSEAKKSHKEWFFPMWEKNGWTLNGPSTRIEFELRRRLLKQLQINSINDLVFQIPDAWLYMTKDWLTIRKVGQDSHRDRWELIPEWLEVQKATDCFGTITGVSRLKQMQPQYNQLMRMIRGCAASEVALNSESIHNGGIKVPKRQLVHSLWNMMRDPSFDEDVKKRQAKFHSMNN